MAIDRRDAIKLAGIGAGVFALSPLAYKFGVELSNIDIVRENKLRLLLATDNKTVPSNWPDQIEWRTKYLDQYQNPVDILSESIRVCRWEGKTPVFFPPENNNKPYFNNTKLDNDVNNKPRIESSSLNQIEQIINELQIRVDAKKGKPLSMGQFAGLMIARNEGNIIAGLRLARDIYGLFCSNQTFDGYIHFTQENGIWRLTNIVSDQDKISDDQKNEGIFAMSKLVQDQSNLIMPVEYIEKYHNAKIGATKILKTAAEISANFNTDLLTVALSQYVLFDKIYALGQYSVAEIQSFLVNAYKLDDFLNQENYSLDSSYGSVRRYGAYNLAITLPHVYDLLSKYKYVRPQKDNNIQHWGPDKTA